MENNVMISKMMINDPLTCVTEGLDGYLLTRSDLRRLEDPIAKVVLRSVLPAGKIALLSGGGSGHEPAHSGLVGEGMLSAAVSGDVFASPPTTSVLKALRALQKGGCSGCVLIVKNYTGDKLAFGSAAEIANRYGFPCEVVLVSDDVSFDGTAKTGNRGLAGVAFVHKVAGALADSGEPLAIVAEAARNVAAVVCTVGASLSTCSIPGQAVSSRLFGARTEIGLGIHGEAGRQLIDKTLTAEELAVQMVNIISRRIPRFSRVAALINNLGSLSGVELGVITKDLVAKLKEEGLVVERLFVAPLVTSFDMKGVSLSLLPINTHLGASKISLIEGLDASTAVSHWPVSPNDGIKIKTVPSDQAWGSQSSMDESSDALILNPDAVYNAFEKIEKALTDASTAIDALDALAGDGDAGATMSRVGAAAAQGARDELKRSRENGKSVTLSKILAAAAESVGQYSGGTSGIFYALMLNVASSSTIGTKSMEGSLNGAEAALSAIQRVGGAVAGDRTLLDALLPALGAARSANAQGLSVKDVINAAADAASDGAKATSTMIPRVGRATYVPVENVRGHEDAGAKAASIWLKALSESATNMS